MRTQPLSEGDRIVILFHDGSVMGYFLNYYNRDYAVCTTDDQPDGQNLLVERRRVSTLTRSAAVPPSANIQILEATDDLATDDPRGYHRTRLRDLMTPPPPTPNKET